MSSRYSFQSPSTSVCSYACRSQGAPPSGFVGSWLSLWPAASSPCPAVPRKQHLVTSPPSPGPAWPEMSMPPVPPQRSTNHRVWPLTLQATCTSPRVGTIRSARSRPPVRSRRSPDQAVLATATAPDPPPRSISPPALQWTPPEMSSFRTSKTISSARSVQRELSPHLPDLVRSAVPTVPVPAPHSLVLKEWPMFMTHQGAATIAIRPEVQNLDVGGVGFHDHWVRFANMTA